MTEWRTERLRRLAQVFVSNVDKKSADGESSVRLCNYTDVYYNAKITADLNFMQATATQEQIRRFTLRAGDTIITKDSETADDIAVPTFVPEDLPDVVCGYHLAVIRPRAGIDGKYLNWCLSSSALKDQFAVQATGVTRFGLRSDAIRNVAIAVPELARQRAVADFLDTEIARIDALVDKRLSMMDLVEEHWTATVDAAVWSSSAAWTPLMSLVPDNRQIMYGIVLPGPNVDSGIPIVKGGDIGAGRLHPRELAKTTPEIEAPFARARLATGDVLFAIRGSIGEVARVPPALQGANITQDVARISPRPGVDGQWLLYALASRRLFQQVAARTTGATIRGVNIWDLERVRVPASDAVEQRRIMLSLKAHDEGRLRTVAAVRRQVELLREHRRALITAAVTGEIDVTKGAA